MKCPACGRDLQEMTVEGITVDVCKGGCGGVWFDNSELKKVDEQHEAAGETLLNVERDGSVAVDHARRRKCPKCGDAVMMRHFFCTEKQVEVDECPGCAGIWLDCGELGTIRSQFATEAEREKVAKEYFTKSIGPELKKMSAESRQKAERARSFARMFRFICPSYYIPGKQDWGAF